MEVQCPQLTRNRREKCVRGEKPDSVTTTPINGYQSTRRFPITSIISFYKTHDCKRQKNMLNLIKVWFYYWFVLPVFTVLPVSPHSPAPSLLSEFYPPLFSPSSSVVFITFLSKAIRDVPVSLERFGSIASLFRQVFILTSFNVINSFPEDLL